MFSIFRRYRELLVVSALIALPLLLFLAGTKEAGERGVVDKAVITVFSPIQKAVTWTVHGAQDIWFGYLYLVGVREENKELRAEILQLRSLALQADEVMLENERLRELVDFKERLGLETVPAGIIAIGAVPAFSRSIRVGKGVGDGISLGDPVITPKGVVGRVVAAGPGWADVMLLSDPNSAVPVVSSRTRTRATVRGTGDMTTAVLDHAARTDDLSEGDLLVTSGTGGIFPRGLPVAEVQEIRRRPHGMFQRGEVSPLVDLTRLEEVLVLVDYREDQEDMPPVVKEGS